MAPKVSVTIQEVWSYWSKYNLVGGNGCHAGELDYILLPSDQDEASTITSCYDLHDENGLNLGTKIHSS